MVIQHSVIVQRPYRSRVTGWMTLQPVYTRLYIERGEVKVILECRWNFSGMSEKVFRIVGGDSSNERESESCFRNVGGIFFKWKRKWKLFQECRRNFYEWKRKWKLFQECRRNFTNKRESESYFRNFGENFRNVLGMFRNVITNGREYFLGTSEEVPMGVRKVSSSICRFLIPLQLGWRDQLSTALRHRHPGPERSSSRLNPRRGETVPGHAGWGHMIHTKNTDSSKIGRVNG